MTPENKVASLNANQLSKRFNREWIFRNVDYSFQQGKVYAITGPNGCGKSTLLQVLWGQLPASSGLLSYTLSNEIIPVESIYQHVSIAAPYLDLIDEFTLEELLSFHFKMRKLRSSLLLKELPELMELDHAKHKTILQFSSGMRQRLKIALAIFTQADFVFLDEPFTNLDAIAIKWYQKQLYSLEKSIVLIASNDPKEYENATDYLHLADYK